MSSHTLRWIRFIIIRGRPYWPSWADVFVECKPLQCFEASGKAVCFQEAVQVDFLSIVRVVVGIRRPCTVGLVASPPSVCVDAEGTRRSFLGREVVLSLRQ